MKLRLVRYALAAGLAVTAVTPVAPAHAWTCQDPVSEIACAVAGVVCRHIPDKVGECQLG